MKRACRGQMKISFGMIFSIILIVVFIAFAFYAIKKFLDFQDTIKVEQFLEELQADIEKIWKGSQASQKEEYSLPSKVEAVCFTNDEYENLFFQSEEIIKGEKIEYIDINKITEKKDPFCIETEKGKVRMILKKGFGETLITIEK